MEGNRRSRRVIATPSKMAQNAPATSNHRPRPDSIAYAMRHQQGSLSDSLLLPFVLSTGPASSTLLLPGAGEAPLEVQVDP
jgi:hypothetical protein